MRNIKSILILICLSVVIMSCPARQGRAGERPLSIIYAGEGIGNIRLGGRMEDVVKNLGWGKPEEFRKDEKKDEYYMIYKAKGLSFIFQINKKTIGESVLQKIVIISPAFITAGRGVRVGDKWADIKEFPSQQRLAMQSSMDGCTGDDKEKDKKVVVCSGIRFIINNKSGVIEGVEVFKKQ